MADINKVVIVGRLTRDAELSYSPAGFAICKFSVAVNDNVKKNDEWVEEVSFFDVVLFGKVAEAISGYLTKGKQVGVGGKLKQSRWEATDGGKRSKVGISATDIQLLGGPGGAVREGSEGAGRNPGDPPADKPF